MADLKVGDQVECAIWLTGTETETEIERWKDVDCAKALSIQTDDGNLVIGPIAFDIKYPGEDRVPPVPDHISGPDVRLLVGEAEIVGRKTAPKANSFLSVLDPRDLERLRQITRDAHAKSNPKDKRLNDAECDLVIQRIGPDAAMAAVRDAVDGGTVH